MKKLQRTTSLVCLLAFVGIPLLTAAEPEDSFAAYAPGSSLTIDHSLWAGILDQYLLSDHPSGINRFDYGALDAAGRSTLDNYLEILEETDPARLDRDEQMAFWINLYNALTVRVILDSYPVASIRDISLPQSRRGPWKSPLISITGTMLSLDDIEHGILRPIWSDPRIHYAVNCASIGCPNLASVPFTGKSLEMMLDDAARGYINHPRGVSRNGRRLVLSSIFNWYSEDFGNSDEVKEHLLSFADKNTAVMISTSSGSLRYDYDWNLNEPD